MKISNNFSNFSSNSVKINLLKDKENIKDGNSTVNDSIKNFGEELLDHFVCLLKEETIGYVLENVDKVGHLLPEGASKIASFISSGSKVISHFASPISIGISAFLDLKERLSEKKSVKRAVLETSFSTASTVAGMKVGAFIGTAIGGPIGAAIGGIVGGTLSSLSAEKIIQKF